MIKSENVEYLVKTEISPFINNFLRIFHENETIEKKEWPVAIIITGGVALEYYFPDNLDLRTGDFDLRIAFWPKKNLIVNSAQKGYFEKEVGRPVLDFDNPYLSIDQDNGEKYLLSVRDNIAIVLLEGIKKYLSESDFNEKLEKLNVKIDNFTLIKPSKKHPEYVTTIAYDIYIPKDSEGSEGPELPTVGHIIDLTPILVDKGSGLELFRTVPMDEDEAIKNFDDITLDSVVSYNYFQFLNENGVFYAPLSYIIWDTVKLLNRSVRFQKSGRKNKLMRYIKKWLALLEGIGKPETWLNCKPLKNFLEKCEKMEPTDYCMNPITNEEMSKKEVLEYLVDNDFIGPNVSRLFTGASVKEVCNFMKDMV